MKHFENWLPVVAKFHLFKQMKKQDIFQDVLKYFKYIVLPWNIHKFSRMTRTARERHAHGKLTVKNNYIFVKHDFFYKLTYVLLPNLFLIDIYVHTSIQQWKSNTLAYTRIYTYTQKYSLCCWEKYCDAWINISKSRQSTSINY